jgi:transcriptional/translational regulatory protein YebC/TACO1
VIEASHSDTSIDIETTAIECGAQNFEKMEESIHESGKKQINARFFTETTDLDSVNKALIDAGWASSAVEMRYIPKNLVTLDEAAAKEVVQFLENIDDNDDVHRVYPALA